MHYHRGLSGWWWCMCQLVWFAYLELGSSPVSFFSGLTALTTLSHNSTFEIWSLRWQARHHHLKGWKLNLNQHISFCSTALVVLAQSDLKCKIPFRVLPTESPFLLVGPNQLFISSVLQGFLGKGLMALICHFTQIAGGESAAAHQPLLWTQTAFWSELEMQRKQNSRTRARTNRQEDRFAGISKARSSHFFLLTVRLLTGIKPYGKDNAAWAHPQITARWKQQHSMLSPGYSECPQNQAKPQKLGNAGPAYHTSLVPEHTKGKLVLLHSHMCTNNRSNLFYRA